MSDPIVVEVVVQAAPAVVEVTVPAPAAIVEVQLSGVQGPSGVLTGDVDLGTFN